jgi:putative lipoic acid-binding regulatory protein
MTDAPKIEFPQLEYPIRVIADAHAELRDQVVSVVRRHDPEFREHTVEIVESRQGAYCSVRMVICATGESQLKALHEELRENPAVKMVL